MRQTEPEGGGVFPIIEIVSGGQTGADRAALDFAIAEGIPHGGWIPRGRRTEAGPLPRRYRMREMATEAYEARTERNVIDSDGTLLLSHGPLAGGSALTLALARKHEKPSLHLDLADTPIADAAARARRWLNREGIGTLNVAGPRASEDPRIYAATHRILTRLFGSPA